MRPVAALFVRSDSIYKSMSCVDAYDAERDALTWRGGCPVVAHPPCRAWSKLRAFAKPRPGETELALFALNQVRRFGGVLEHPAGSLLWRRSDMPPLGTSIMDRYGGFLMAIPQRWFGHRAEKATVFYIVGLSPVDVPGLPFDLSPAVTTVERMCKAERERTPPLLAQWLVELARRCSVSLPVELAA